MDIPIKIEKPGKCYICSQYTGILYSNWNKVREKVRLAIALKNLDLDGSHETEVNEPLSVKTDPARRAPDAGF